MDKQWSLMNRALAALVCLAMVLVWVPGKALAAEDTINIWVIYSTINSNGTREDYIKELKTIFEDTIKKTTKIFIVIIKKFKLFPKS